MKLDELPAAGAEDLQLAIETTGRTGSLALLRGDRVFREQRLPTTSRTAASLAVELQTLLRWCRGRHGWPQFLSVAAGPGSFTGLRIGVTTAKTLSYALRLPLVAVDSLAAIAAAAASDHPDAKSILVGVNAYRGQVFSAQYCREELLCQDSLGETKRGAIKDRVVFMSSRSEVLGRDAWNARWGQIDAATSFTGDLSAFPGCESSRFLHRSSADAVGAGRIGLLAAAAGCWADPIALAPRYLKPSAAEEKAAGGELNSGGVR